MTLNDPLAAKLPVICCNLSHQVNVSAQLHISGHFSKPIDFRKFKQTIVGETTHVKHIIVIDDDPDFGHLMDRVLHTIDQGIKVTRTTSGRDAIQKMKSDPPKIALVDLVMPGLNGLEVIELMRTIPALDDTRIFLITVTDYAAETMGDGISEFSVRLPDNEFPFEILDCICATSSVVRQRYVT